MESQGSDGMQSGSGEFDLPRFRAAMGVLSRHTVTRVDGQSLAKAQPVTFAVTTRHHAVTVPAAYWGHLPGERNREPRGLREKPLRKGEARGASGENGEGTGEIGQGK
jgi:hypothetical protein